MTAPSAEPLTLDLRSITKRFGAAVAVDDVSLAVRRGSVHALLGENGAGKTTLMRVAFGMLRPGQGQVLVNGTAARFHSAADAIAAGIGMVHQHFTHVGAMTVAENVALGHAGRYSAAQAAERVERLGERTGLRLDPLARVNDLPVGAQQRLEILKALGRSATCLIMDEPTAVLAPNEASELLHWLRAFASEGNAVVLITHKLKEALDIADDVTVLRRGRNVLFAPRASVDAPTLAAALLGEAQADLVDVSLSVGDRIVAQVDGVHALDDRGVPTLHAVSLAVRSGEIVGVAAVEGAGQHELLRVLAERLSPARGSAALPTTIGFIPEDRHRDALILDFSSTENIALHGAGARRGLMPWTALTQRTQALVTQFDVRGAHAGRPVRSLSGGNQQKLVLARELADNPDLVVAENPTRGLDIRATRDVHDRLRAAAVRGAGVVVYSSDLDEVLALATRVVVLHAGHLVDVPRDRAAVGRAMLGVA